MKIDFDGKDFNLPTTNNLCEISFRDLKWNARRTTGKKNLSQMLNSTPAEIMYLQKLTNPEYCRIIFEGLPIHEAFAKNSEDKVKEIKATMKTDPTKKPNLKVTRNPDFLTRNPDFLEGNQEKLNRRLV